MDFEEWDFFEAIDHMKRLGHCLQVVENNLLQATGQPEKHFRFPRWPIYAIDQHQSYANISINIISLFISQHKHSPQKETIR